jgi:hypothetical protein
MLRILALLLLTTAVAEAQTAPRADGCPAADTVAEPATPPQPGAEGTAPGNAGSTGWTGGLGGSQIGTNTAGAVATSKTWQPPTARGLDLMSAPEPVAAAGC